MISKPPASPSGWPASSTKTSGNSTAQLKGRWRCHIVEIAPPDRRPARRCTVAVSWRMRCDRRFVGIVVALASASDEAQTAQFGQNVGVVGIAWVIRSRADQRVAHLDVLVEDERQAAICSRRHVGHGAHHQVDGGDLRGLRVEIDAVEVIFQDEAGVVLQSLEFRRPGDEVPISRSKGVVTPCVAQASQLGLPFASSGARSRCGRSRPAPGRRRSGKCRCRRPGRSRADGGYRLRSCASRRARSRHRACRRPCRTDSVPASCRPDSCTMTWGV